MEHATLFYEQIDAAEEANKNNGGNRTQHKKEKRTVIENINVKIEKQTLRIVVNMISYKRELRRFPLPDVILSKIISYCTWKKKRTRVWYIIASKLNPNALGRAKQIDEVNEFLYTDEQDDRAALFRTQESLYYLDHIKKNNV